MAALCGGIANFLSPLVHLINGAPGVIDFSYCMKCLLEGVCLLCLYLSYCRHSKNVMKGLVEFAKASKVTGTSVTIREKLNEMSKAMMQAETSSQNLLLLCDYNTNDAINLLFEDQQRYTNVQNLFGSI